MSSLLNILLNYAFVISKDPAGDGCVTTPFLTLTQVAYQLRSFSQKLILLCFGGINYQLVNHWFAIFSSKIWYALTNFYSNV